MSLGQYTELEKKYKKLYRQVCKLQDSVNSGYKFVVDTYDDLLLETATEGDFAWVRNDQGTYWLPGGLGGDYYPLGTYFYDGVSWINDKTQIALALHQYNIDLTALESTVTTLDTDLTTHVSDLANPHATPIGGGDLITDVITQDTVDVYYRGFNRNGDWEIQKYTEDDISNFVVATEPNNLAYTTLALAWTNKLTLTYV